MVECNIISNWGEPERAPPSLYNEEISVCLSARTFKRQKICLGRPGKFWGPHAHYIICTWYSRRVISPSTRLQWTGKSGFGGGESANGDGEHRRLPSKGKRDCVDAERVKEHEGYSVSHLAANVCDL